jgi:hypothetical protein
MSKSETADKGAIQRRIDRYLKEVDEVLKRCGSSWHDRNNIRDNIQTQIREMLAQRSLDMPTLADVDAVIAGLDDPESYAPEATEATPCRKENPLRPLYKFLSYLFLFLFITSVLQIIMFIVRTNMNHAGPNKTQALIYALVFSVIVSAILFHIANFFSKAAKK